MPVLVDFGFAERYDVNSPEAFHSNLSYGTPEVRLFRSLRRLSAYGLLLSVTVYTRDYV